MRIANHIHQALLGLLGFTFFVKGQECWDSSSCSEGGWCNIYGWCESEELYGRCGPNFNYAPCSQGQTCSIWGYCVEHGEDGGFPKQRQQYGIIETCVAPGMWAFTLDDGPDPVLTPAILDILQEEGVPVTFFVVGNSLTMYPTGPSILQRAYAEGHQIASHTYNHYALTSLSDYEITQQMKNTNDVIHSIIGVKPVFMRPPYGDYNEHVLQILNQEGFVAVNWNMVSYDCDYNLIPGTDWKIIQEFRQATSQSPVSQQFISLSHDIQDNTLRTLREVLGMIKANGYRFVRMDECLGYQYPAYQ